MEEELKTLQLRGIDVHSTGFKSKLHELAKRLPGGLTAEANEEFLLHGTKPEHSLTRAYGEVCGRKDVYYLFVCRVAVGHVSAWNKPGRASSALFGNGSDSRLLTEVPQSGGVPISYPHCREGRFGMQRRSSYREVVSSDATHVYPEYVIAVQRQIQPKNRV